MKRIVLITGLLISLATSVIAQENDEQPKVNLPDAVMEQVVKRIVTWYFKAPKKPKTIYFAAENIKKEWLPKISNINFVILESSKSSSYEDAYRRDVNVFLDTEKSRGRFTINFGYGIPHCGATGDTWAFRILGSRVRLWKQPFVGWGSGCSSPSHA